MRGRAFGHARAGLLHETGYAFVLGAVVGDDGVTGEGSAGVDGTGFPASGRLGFGLAASAEGALHVSDMRSESGGLWTFGQTLRHGVGQQRVAADGVSRHAFFKRLRRNEASRCRVSEQRRPDD
jgi:hypothetical protein